MDIITAILGCWETVVQLLCDITEPASGNIVEKLLARQSLASRLHAFYFKMKSTSLCKQPVGLLVPFVLFKPPYIPLWAVSDLLNVAGLIY